MWETEEEKDEAKSGSSGKGDNDSSSSVSPCDMINFVSLIVSLTMSQVDFWGSSSAVCEVQILYFFANADVQLGFEMWLWSLHMHAVYFFFQFIFEFFFTQAVINIRHIYNVC